MPALVSDKPRLEGALARFGELVPAAGENGAVAVRLREPGGGAVADVVRALDQSGVALSDLTLRQPTLDDVFLAKTGRPLEAGEGEEPEPAVEAEAVDVQGERSLEVPEGRADLRRAIGGCRGAEPPEVNVGVGSPGRRMGRPDVGRRSATKLRSLRILRRGGESLPGQVRERHRIVAAVSVVVSIASGMSGFGYRHSACRTREPAARAPLRG